MSDSVFVSYSYKPTAADQEYVKCFETIRGAIQIMAAGTSGTIDVYQKINGVAVPVQLDIAITCAPPLVIQRIIGSGVEVCIRVKDVDVGDCIQLQVNDINAAIVNVTTSSGTPGTIPTGNNCKATENGLVYDDCVHDALLALKTHYNESAYSTHTDETLTIPADTVHSLQVSIIGSGATLSIDGGAAETLYDGQNILFTADDLLEHSHVFVIDNSTTVLYWRTF